MNPYLKMKPLSEVYGTTIGVTFASLPGTIPNACEKAVIQVELAGVRAHFNGSTVGLTYGSGGGFLMMPGNDYVIEGRDNLTRMRLLGDDSSVDAVINVIYQGEGDYS